MATRIKTSACGKYIPATSAVQNNQTGTNALDGTYLVEASF